MALNLPSSPMFPLPPELIHRVLDFCETAEIRRLVRIDVLEPLVLSHYPEAHILLFSNRDRFERQRVWYVDGSVICFINLDEFELFVTQHPSFSPRHLYLKRGSQLLTLRKKYPNTVETAKDISCEILEPSPDEIQATLSRITSVRRRFTTLKIYLRVAPDLLDVEMDHLELSCATQYDVPKLRPRKTLRIILFDAETCPQFSAVDELDLGFHRIPSSVDLRSANCRKVTLASESECVISLQLPQTIEHVHLKNNVVTRMEFPYSNLHTVDCSRPFWTNNSIFDADTVRLGPSWCFDGLASLPIFRGTFVELDLSLARGTIISQNHLDQWPKLKRLSVFGASLQTTTSPALTHLSLIACEGVQDLPLPASLISLRTADCQLDAINVLHLHELRSLEVWSNPLRELDLTANTHLRRLDISRTQISRLVAVPETLESLGAFDVVFDSLDLSSCSINHLNVHFALKGSLGFDVKLPERVISLELKASSLPQLSIGCLPHVQKLTVESNAEELACPWYLTPGVLLVTNLVDLSILIPSLSCDGLILNQLEDSPLRKLHLRLQSVDIRFSRLPKGLTHLHVDAGEIRLRDGEAFSTLTHLQLCHLEATRCHWSLASRLAIPTQLEYLTIIGFSERTMSDYVTFVHEEHSLMYMTLKKACYVGIDKFIEHARRRCSQLQPVLLDAHAPKLEYSYVMCPRSSHDWLNVIFTY